VIARREQPPFGLVPEHERPLPDETGGRVDAPGVVRRDHVRAVPGVLGDDDPAGRAIPAQLRPVVDATIEHEGTCTDDQRHRLVELLRHRVEARAAQAHRSTDPDIVTVGPVRGHRLGETRDHFPDDRPAVVVKDRCDGAHAPPR
jgi:hypothetical protein